MSQYVAVAEAYMDALEARLQRNLTMQGLLVGGELLRVACRHAWSTSSSTSASSSTQDAAERRRLEGLKGRAGVANSKVVYERFAGYLNARRWQLLAAAGAKVQRVLWASTSTKNPAYPDTLYVDELIGEHTVNTLPESLIDAFRDHGKVARTVDKHLDDAHRVLRELGAVGIDMEQVGAQLQIEGIDLFAKSYNGVLDIVERRRDELLAREAATDGRRGGRSARRRRARAWRRFDGERVGARLWAADPTLWKAGDAGHQKVIANALGWLTVFDDVADQLDDLAEFVAEVRDDGLRARRAARHGRFEPGARRSWPFAFGAGEDGLDLTVLDTTDPAAIAARRGARRPRGDAFHRVEQVGRHDRDGQPARLLLRSRARRAGPRDGRPALRRRSPTRAPRCRSSAQEQEFRAVFINPSDIGGRYSALSFFGLVPAALLGLDVDELLDRARAMAARCAADVRGGREPGAAAWAPSSGRARWPAATRSPS